MGNLVLALGFSGGLHAALLSSLDLLPVQWTSATQLRLTLRVEERPVEAPTVSPLPSGKPATAKRGKAVASATAVGKSEPAPYLTSREVDVPARPRGTVPLIYPENPLIWKLRGVVRLRLLISEIGAIDLVEVVNAEPPGEFEEAALDAARRMRYDPAVKNGRPVKSQKLIEVTFDPHERKEKR